MLHSFLGPAPRAKLNEQRKRRFDPSRSRTEGDDTVQFDLLKITPGTQFMLELSDRIKRAVEAKRQDNENWKHLDVVFSGPDVEGEAEHKLMDYMRAKPENLKWMKTHTHCFFGNDADLALLALVTHAERFDIVRKVTARHRLANSVGSSSTAIASTDAATSSSVATEAAAPAEDAEPTAPAEEAAGADETTEDQTTDAEAVEDAEEEKDAKPKDVFEKMPVTSLRGIMRSELQKRDELQKKMQSDPNILERAIDDFILLCLFIGNDFMPSVPKLEIKDDGLNALISVYKTFLLMRMKNPKVEPYIMGSKGQISWEALQQYFQFVYDTNKARFEETSKERNAALQALFGTISPSQEAIQSWCRDYLKTLQWVVNTYYRGCPSWSWCFPYASAPFIGDLLKFLPVLQRELKSNLPSLKFDLSQPLAPLQHLLAVIPPENHYLLPTCYAAFVSGHNSFWPSKENRTTAPLLTEEVVSEMIKKCAEEYDQKLTDGEKERNRRFGQVNWARLKAPPAAPPPSVARPPSSSSPRGGSRGGRGGVPSRGGSSARGSSRGRGR